MAIIINTHLHLNQVLTFLLIEMIKVTSFLKICDFYLLYELKVPVKLFHITDLWIRTNKSYKLKVNIWGKNAFLL